MNSCSRIALLLLIVVCALLAGLATVLQYFVAEHSMALSVQALVLTLIVGFSVWVIFAVTLRFDAVSKRAKSVAITANTVFGGAEVGLPDNRYTDSQQDQSELRRLMGELAALEDQYVTEIDRIRCRQET